MDELPKLIQPNGEYVNKYKTELETKRSKVFEWVKDNITFDKRYGGHFVPTEEVLKKDKMERFGCCLEFANVAVALLRAMGCNATSKGRYC